LIRSKKVMKPTMKLTARMALAFGLLVLVILILSGIGILSMKRIGRMSASLATENVPEISLANDIERHALSMVPSLHDYGYTDDEAFLGEVKAQLGEVKKFLTDARSHGQNSASMVKLTEAAVAGQKAVSDFEMLTEQRSQLTQGLAQERQSTFDAGTNFIAICVTFQEKQTEALQGKIRAGIEGDQLETNLRRIGYLAKIVESGNLMLANTWKAEARRDPRLLLDSLGLLEAINTQFNELEKITDFENDLKRIAACRVCSQNYRAGVNHFQEKWLAREALARQQTALAVGVIQQAQKVAALGLDDTTTAMNRTAKVAAFSATLVITCGIIGTLVGILLSTQTTRSIVRQLCQNSETLWNGNREVTAISKQLTGASQSLAEVSSQQAASLEEASASLEELSSMTKRNSENACKANELAKQARTAADKGVGDMQTMSAAMEAIKVSSDDIAKIIKTIDEIAFQTNILALNAAVEAARAGEAGMGFAVVADEVRNLAQRCAQAAKETTSKIEGAITKTGQGVDISSQVRETLNDIVTKVRQVDELVAAVSSASQEQTDGITQLNATVSQMDTVTQGNAASAEESASAAKELNAQAELMKQSVSELLQLVGGAGAQRADVENLAQINQPGSPALPHGQAPKLNRPDRPNQRTITSKLSRF
jgi:methyl-accepting chemotaxis protein